MTNENVEYVEEVEEVEAETNNGETQPVNLDDYMLRTTVLTDYLQSQTDYLAQQMMSNLMWIAATAVVDFGVEPTIEDILEAYPMALSPDTYVYDREMLSHTDSVDHRGEPSDEATGRDAYRFDERKGVTTKQYESIMRNSEFVTLNKTILKELKEQGFEPTTSREDRYQQAVGDRRVSMQRWRSNDSQVKYLRKAKLQEAGRKLAETMDL